MKKLSILVYGKHPQILKTVLRLINNNNNWLGEGHTEEEDVIELFLRKAYDLVLLGGGISKGSEKKIRTLFEQLRPNTPIIQHYGGGSGLLKSEIESALQQQQQCEVRVRDNPFN